MQVDEDPIREGEEGDDERSEGDEDPMEDYPDITKEFVEEGEEEDVEDDEQGYDDQDEPKFDDDEVDAEGIDDIEGQTVATEPGGTCVVLIQIYHLSLVNRERADSSALTYRRVAHTPDTVF